MTEARDDRRPQVLPYHRHRDANIASPRYLIKGLLPERGVGLLSGQSGTFKSFVLVKLVGAGSTLKRPFIEGHATKRQGAALVFLSEGFEDFPLRIEVLSEAEHEGAKLPIFHVSHEIALLDSMSVADIIATASKINDEAMRDFKLPLTLIAFDTLSGCAGYMKTGDENDSVVGAKLMAALAKISEASGTFVIGVDHFGKALETGTRGSSAKEARADVVMSILASKEITGKVASSRLVFRKLRSGAAGKEFPFTMRTVALGEDEDGDPLSSLVVEFGAEEAVPSSTRDDPDAWPKAAAMLRRIVMAMLPERGELIRPVPDGPEILAIRSEIVRGEFFAQSPSGDDDAKKRAARRRQAYKRAIGSAQDQRRIEVREIGGIEYMWLASNTPSSPTQATT